MARIEFIEGVELLRDGEWVECTTLQHTDSMGCEHLYYMAKDTGELLAAELIDGRWLDVELGMARAKLAEIQASFA